MTYLVHRYGADQIPVRILPYGGCRRDPRHPQGAAAIKFNLEYPPFGRSLLLSKVGGGQMVEFKGKKSIFGQLLRRACDPDTK